MTAETLAAALLRDVPHTAFWDGKIHVPLDDAIAALRAALDEAEARAVKAEAERDAANALLREAVSKIQSLYDGIAPLGEGRFAEADETVQAARAHLGAKP